jgi:tRNA synthetase class II (G, H, P, S and T)
MTAPVTAASVDELRRIGLCWYPSGQAGLRGPLLALADRCDRAIVSLAAIWDASEERHPASLPAARLQRIDYLRSFPHQASLSARLDPAGLAEFLSGEVVGEHGEVALTQLSPIREILTPAACYHLYSSREDESFDRPLYLTTRNTCFRHESRYEPLRRLWSFTMREIVCLGTKAETVAFLQRARVAVDEFLRLIDLPVEWLTATDPFFQPQSNPKYLLQRVQPTKHEATYGGDLAIASLNLHHDHFGTAFGITRDGGPAHSACLAFGIERWLFAITQRHGTDPQSWPRPEEAAQKVRARQ